MYVLHMYASPSQLLTKYLSGSLNRRKRFGNIRSDWRLILNWNLEIENSGDMGWIHLAYYRIHLLALVKIAVKFLVRLNQQNVFTV
jgi:hypothetical protein